jgi:putative inorganic carbon (hco3(-)) transporter
MPTKKFDLICGFFLTVLLISVTFSNALVEIAIAGLSLVFITKAVLRKRFIAASTPVDNLLYLLCALVAVSCLRSHYIHESLRGVLRMAKYALLYFSLIDYLSTETENKLKRILWVVMYVMGFTCINGIFQDIWGFDLLRHRRIDTLDYLHRISASFVHPNDFGAFLITFLPVAIAAFLAEHARKKKLFFGSICLLGIYCLLRTSSRGAWLGLFVGMALYLFFYNRKILLLLPVIAALFVLSSPSGIDRISGFFSLEKNTVWERMQLWKGAWNMIREHPVLGFGINTFSQYFGTYKPVDYPDIRYAHNSYLQMWSEIGLIGLMAFFAVLSVVFRMALRNMASALKAGPLGYMLLGLTAGFTGFLIQSAFDTNLYSLVLITLFWVVSACIVSLGQLIEKRAADR